MWRTPGNSIWPTADDILMQTGASMHGGTPVPQKPSGSKLSSLSNWPRYPGGAIAGALIAVASVLLFFVGVDWLQSVLPAALLLVVVLWALRPRRLDD
jgi:hypothetical protein